MSVRTRITCFIAGTGLIASLLFSVAVFLELEEQPLRIMDAVLQEEAYRTTEMILEKQKAPASADSIDDVIYPFWIEIFRPGTHQRIYRSALAKKVHLAPVRPGARAIVDAVIPAGPLKSAHRNNGRKMLFRVRTFLFKLGGATFVVQAARPMGKLEEEIRELVIGIGAGLVFSTLALIAVSWLAAGKILQPIGAMRDLAQDISEKNLDQRIPLGKERDEFSELAGTINRMLDRLQYSFARQKDFLFDTSHELKTPLTTMRLAVDEICAHADDRLPAAARENISRLKEQVLRMERLVRDLLNLSSLETLAGIEPRPVHIPALLSSLVAEYRFLADARHIQLITRMDDDGMVEGDAEKLNRAFSNILDNAVKYNVDGGRIEMATRASAAELTIVTTNTGPGVAESDVNRVFEQFYRVEKSRSHRYGGSGLGLAIVKKIVELHAGSVQLESEPGVWTRVTVRLPRNCEGQRFKHGPGHPYLASKADRKAADRP